MQPSNRLASLPNSQLQKETAKVPLDFAFSCKATVVKSIIDVCLAKCTEGNEKA
jgi:hypothetical protein